MDIADSSQPVIVLPSPPTWADLMDAWADSHAALAGQLRTLAADMRRLDEAVAVVPIIAGPPPATDGFGAGSRA